MPDADWYLPFPQSVQDISPDIAVIEPAGHGVTVLDAPAQYCPAGAAQLTHTVAPKLELSPIPQVWQVALSVAPEAVEKVPPKHCMHVLLTVAPLEADQVPPGHWVQAVPAPSTAYVPAAQVWQAVSTLSLKYFPAPQQTAVLRVAEQWRLGRFESVQVSGFQEEHVVQVVEELAPKATEY